MVIIKRRGTTGVYAVNVYRGAEARMRSTLGPIGRSVHADENSTYTGPLNALHHPPQSPITFPRSLSSEPKLGQQRSTGGGARAQNEQPRGATRAGE